MVAPHGARSADYARATCVGWGARLGFGVHRASVPGVPGESAEGRGFLKAPVEALRASWEWPYAYGATYIYMQPGDNYVHSEYSYLL